ncbi:MAG: hypothetical protein KKB70_07825 [Proteobacteria bacterium]|nr:hypothetical protein [Pseudomonadota bacterium]MBU1611117.1 hypothetical protein [Pseudomonadota bacterium]
MKNICTAMLLILVCLALSAPAFAGCPVDSKKHSDKSFKAATAVVEDMGESAEAVTVEITEPGTAVTAMPGVPSTQPGPANAEDKAVLDALTLDRDAAKAAMP